MANPEKSNEVSLLMEQYKLYVEMADRISRRRVEANKYYSTILTGFLAALSFIIEKANFKLFDENLILFSISILGVATSLLWFVNLRSYRLINSAKFKVIHEMEKNLPIACFDHEWRILKGYGYKKKYLTLSSLEQTMPLFFLLVYLCIFIYTIYRFIEGI